MKLLLPQLKGIWAKGRQKEPKSQETLELDSLDFVSESDLMAIVPSVHLAVTTVQEWGEQDNGGSHLCKRKGEIPSG